MATNRTVGGRYRLATRVDGSRSVQIFNRRSLLPVIEMAVGAMHPGGTAGSSRPAGPNSRLDIRKGALQTLTRFAPGSVKMTWMVDVPGAAEHCVQRARGVDVPSRAFHGPTCTATHQPPDPGKGSSLLAEPSTRTRQQHPSLAMGRWDGKLGRAHGLVPAPSEERFGPNHPGRKRPNGFESGSSSCSIASAATEDGIMATRRSTARSCGHMCRRQPWRSSPCRTIAATRWSYRVCDSPAERCSERALCRRRCADFVCLRTYGVATAALEQTAIELSAEADPGSPWDGDDAVCAYRYPRTRGIQILETMSGRHSARRPLAS